MDELMHQRKRQISKEIFTKSVNLQMSAKEIGPLYQIGRPFPNY